MDLPRLVWATLAVAARRWRLPALQPGALRPRGGHPRRPRGHSKHKNRRSATGGEAAAAAAPRMKRTTSNEPPASNRSTGATAAPPVADASPASSVQVVVTALQAAWVQLTRRRQDSFTGMLKAERDDARFRPIEQVKIVAGNAGGLTVLAQRKDARSAGTGGPGARGQADGGRSAVPPKTPPPAPDPL